MNRITLNSKFYRVTIRIHEDDTWVWEHVFDSRKEAVEFVARCITTYYCYEVKFEECANIKD